MMIRCEVPAPLIGRRTELAALHGLLGAAGTGAPGAAEIVGDPGIGKTRLLAELAEQARRLGWVVLRGRANDFDRRTPFGMVREALAGQLGAAAPAGLDGADPGLVKSMVAGQLEPSAIERYRLYRAVHGLLTVLARPTGLALILDDLHWADDSSAEFVAHLLRDPPPGRLLLAVAHRPRQTPDRLRAALARATQAGGLVRVPVGPLTAADVAQLLAGAGQAHPRRLHAASGGNPLYLQALAARAPAGAAPTGRIEAAGPAGGVPEPVRAVLLAELARLDPRQLLVARACAVAGDGSQAALIAGTAACALDETLPVLDELAAHDILRVRPADGRFEFRHPLVCQVVYAAAGAGWRVGAHARAAAALRAAGAPAAEVAHHVEHSARRGDMAAVDVLRDAAEMTIHRSPATAARQMRTALRLVPDGPDTLLVRLDLLAGQARALALTGGLRDSRETLHELRRLVPAGLVELRAWIAAFGARIERLLGRHAEADAQLQAALAALPDQDSRAALALKLGLATGAAVRADSGPDGGWSAKALATAGRLNDRPALAAAYAICVLARHAAGHADDETGIWLDRAAAIADALPDGELADNLQPLAWLGWAEVRRERSEDAARHLHRALAIAEDAGRSHVAGLIHAMLGAVHTMRGDLEQAARQLADGRDAALRTGSAALRDLVSRDQSWSAVAAADRTWAGPGRLIAAAAAASRDVDANRQLAEAITLFLACEAGGQVEHAMREQRQATSRQPRRRRASAHCGHLGGTAVEIRLTPRENSILSLLAESLTADAIARRLSITAGTVHKHLTSLYRKLGTHDRLATVLRAQHVGLLPARPGEAFDR